MPAKQQTPTALYNYPKYWAECLLPAPFLPMSRDEMDQLGWDSCDVILVTGDAYVDHPSFGMALIGRLLEAQGFRVGILVQPDWNSAADFKILGKPNLFFGVTAGNMDSMINHYTANRKVRNDDAYSPGGRIGLRPDRATLGYCQRDNSDGRVSHLGDQVGGANQVATDNISGVLQLDLIDVQFVACKVNDHAGDANILRHPKIGKIAAQKICTA